MSRWFGRFAARASYLAGTAPAFLFAVVAVSAWFGAGLLRGFTDTHQLVINTATTIVTFLMVFLIQHQQSVDTRAMQTKLDELITHLEGPRDEVAGIEGRDES
jgi:low affinity Fe/Cu permease